MVKVFIKGCNEKSCVVIHYRSHIKDRNNCSDNMCEWLSLLDALEIIRVREYTDVTIYTDSRLLFYQLNKILNIDEHEKKWSYKKMRDYYLKWNKIVNEMSEKNIKYCYINPKENIARGYIK